MLQLTYTIAEARQITGLGHTKFYEELNSGRLKARKCGRRTLIAKSDLETWLDGLQPYPVRGA